MQSSFPLDRLPAVCTSSAWGSVIGLGAAAVLTSLEAGPVNSSQVGLFLTALQWGRRDVGLDKSLICREAGVPEFILDKRTNADKEE